MSLEDRRTQLTERLQEFRTARTRYQEAVIQLTSQIDQMVGAISMLDSLIAEEGNGHASSVESPATVHGDEVRASEESEVR